MLARISIMAFPLASGRGCQRRSIPLRVNLYTLPDPLPVGLPSEVVHRLIKSKELPHLTRQHRRGRLPIRAARPFVTLFLGGVKLTIGNARSKLRKAGLHELVVKL